MARFGRWVGIAALAALAACGGGSPEPRRGAELREATAFTNGDFESDAIGATPPAGWTVQNYLNSTGVSGTASAPPSTFPALNLSGLGTAINETYVVGGTTQSQADPDLGTGQAFRFPAYGARSARVNYRDSTENGDHKNANVLRQGMTVGLADVDPVDGQIHVRFALAPVLENPSHSFGQQPYFFVELLNLSRGTSLYSAFNVAGQAGVPWHTTTSVKTGNATQWLDWQIVDIAPGSSALAPGEQVQLTVVASGCALGGHFGRVYLDGMGAFIPGPYVTASAPQSVNAGSTLTYTLSYSNGGTTQAVGAHVDMVTPSKTTFASVAGVPAACTTPAAGSSGTISCPLGTLAAGATGSFTVTVNVDPGATGTIVDGNYTIGAVGATTLLGPKVQTSVISASTATADVAVVKTAGFAAVQPGQSIPSSGTPLYTITITNNSPTNAVSSSATPSARFSFSDAVPAQVTGVTWTCTATAAGTGIATKCKDKPGASGGNIANGSGNAISLKPRLGANGGQVTIKVYGTISASASGTLVNTASGTLSGLVDPLPANNSSTVSTPIGATQTLAVTRAGSGSGTVVSAPAGINCGSTCSAGMVTGSQVVLTASPSGSSSFSGWSGAGAPAACTSGAPRTCTLTMDAAKAVTATFAAPPAVSSPAALYAYGGSGQYASTSTGFSSPLLVLVVDANGTPVSGATVSFAAVPVAGATATLSAGTAATNASGIASVSVTAGATPGAYTVSASLAALTPAAFALTNVGPPASISYVNGGNGSDPQLAPVGATFAAPLVAQVKDAAGSVLPGVAVTYAAVPVAGASAVLSNVTATDAAGMSSATAAANSTTGAYTVTASVAGVATPAVFSLQNTSTGPAAVYVVSGSPQIAPVSTAYGNPLVVTVADAAGNALPGVAVTFQAPASGATATLGGGSACSPASGGCQVATTDASGLAGVTATASATGGPFTVAASAAGVATSASFSLVNDGGYTVSVNDGGIQSAVINTAFGTALSALVVDTATDTPVSGATVTFQAPASGATATLGGGSACPSPSGGCQRATTNASGVASVTATANGLSGTYPIGATTPNAPSAAAFTLTNECTASSQCSGTTPICGGSAACASCSSNAECTAKDATTPYCDVTGACVACTADAQCGGSTPICSQATSACTACTTDAQCADKDPAAPACAVATGACTATYTVTASAGANGSISPSGPQTVLAGGSVGFTFTPAAGYRIADVVVDGASAGTPSSYTFTNVSANHTIAASFVLETHTITASAGMNGLISPAGPVVVNDGSDQSFDITPLAGYHVADVLVDGVSVGAPASYAFTAVTASHTIAASFAIDTYTITASAGANGAISPAGAVSVDAGADQGFTIAADPGYAVADVLVDGVSVGAVAGYTFAGVAATHTLSASFALVQQPAAVVIAPASLGATYDGTPKPVSVTTVPAGLAVSVTYDGAPTPPTAAGTYAVVVAVADPGYSGSATGSLVIAKATPVLGWASPAGITYGTALSASQLDATSSVPGAFLYSPSAGAVLDAGSGQVLSVSFTPSDAANYGGASASVTINVARAAQTVAFAPPAAKTYGDAPFDLAPFATGGASGNPVRFSVVSGPGSIAGTALTLGGAGTIVVAADQAGSQNYSAAATVQATIAVGKATAAVTLDAAGLSVTYDGTPKPVSVTTTPAALGVGVTYGGSATPPTGAGTYAVVATVNDADYQGSATGSLVIAKASQAIAFNPPAAKTYGDAAFDLAPFATGGASGNPVTFSVVSGPGSVAGTTLTLTGAGTIVLAAHQAGDQNYGPAATVQGSIAVGKATAAVTIDAAGLNATYDGTPKPVAVTTTPAGLTVSITYGGASTAPTNAGNYAVVATVIDASYHGSASASLVIAKATPTVTWANPAAIAYGTALSATQLNATSIVPGTFVYTPPSGTVLGAGNGQTLSASFTPSDAANYGAASASVTIDVAKATQSISFNPPAAKTYGDAPFDLAPSALGGASGDPVTFSVVSGPGSLAGTILSITGAGAIVVSADQAGNQNYSAAATVQATITVGKGGLLVTLRPSPTPSVTGQRVTLTVNVMATSGSAAPTGSATITDGAAILCGPLPLAAGSATCSTTFLAAGSHSLTAACTGDADYSASSGTATHLVDKGTASLSLTGPATSVAREPATFTATVAAVAPAAGVPSGTVTFTDGLTTLCGAVPLSAGVATCSTSGLAVGAHTVVASYAGDLGFGPASGSLVHTVDAAPGTVTVSASRNPTRAGRPTVLTAVVTYPSAQPSGSVDFRADGGLLGTAALSGGSASITVRDLARGTHAITAAYAGGDGLAPASGDLPGGLVVENTPPVAGSGTAVAFGPEVTGASGTALAGALDGVRAAELWVRALPDAAAGATLLRLGDAAAPALALRLEAEQTGIDVVLGPSSAIAAAPIADGAWHHVALSSSGGHVTVFVDAAPVVDAVAPLDLSGARAVALGEGLAGELDEVRLWSTARTAAELAADLRRPVAAGAPGLVALWRMDEGSGTEILDAGPAQADLTIAAASGAQPFVASTAWRERRALEERPLDPVAAGYDADGDPLTLTLTAPPAHGTATVDENGLALGYASEGGYLGLDTFTFRLDDGTDHGEFQIEVEIQSQRPATCTADSDCASGEACLLGVCTAPADVVGRAGSHGCGTAGAGPTALWALLVLFLRRRREPAPR